MTAPVIPQSSEELAEMIADRKVISEVLNAEDRTLWPKLMTAYANKVNKVDRDVERQISEQIERTWASFAKENFADMRRPDMRPATGADARAARQTGNAYMKHTPGTKLNGKFGSLMGFIDIVTGDPRDPETSGLRKEIRDAMSSTDPSLGGFLIPEEFRTQLMEVALDEAVVRPRATVIPMSTLRTSIPFVDVTSNATTVSGGIIGYWTEEGAALTASQPKFGRVALEAKKLTAYTEIPNELRQDSNPAAEAYARTAFPKAVAAFEDYAFLLGTGVGEPLGVFNATNAAIVATAAESGQTSLTIVWENIIKMYARMLPEALNRAVWVVSNDTLPQLMTTALTVGVGGAPIGMANFDGTSGPVLSLLGRPVVVSQRVNKLGLQGDISFVDFSQYLIGDRMAMSAELSTDYKFANDSTAFRFIERVDGRPWVQSAITPRNGGATLSPYVQLAARP